VRLYQRGLLRQRRLRAKVVSIGNIAWGGTGKTPFTIWLAARLQSRGLKVSILTRGYRRSSPERVKVIPPGTAAGAVRMDGDEVQLYLRHLSGVAVGIGASRYDAGRLLEERFPVDVHLLDDGFQHLALGRDLDLVLLDASDPWAKRSRAGLLRESSGALRRARAILLHSHRPVSGDAVWELMEQVHRINSAARTLQVRTELRNFEALGGGSCSVAEMRSRRPVAFCALGNPQGFFNTLTNAEIRLLACRTYHDHHRYAPEDLARIERLARQSGADCLITTEKDLVNLPADVAPGIPLYWAAIGTIVEQEAALIRSIGQSLGSDPKSLPADAGAVPQEVSASR
jgi:tetraacyldisaccharide 4'-kinase